MVELCCEYLSVRCIWLYGLIVLRLRFRVNPQSIVVWMSRKSLLKIVRDMFVNFLWLFGVTPFQFLVELNIGAANYRFSFSTRCILSKTKASGLGEIVYNSPTSIIADKYEQWLRTFCFCSLIDLFNKHLISRMARR